MKRNLSRVPNDLLGGNNPNRAWAAAAAHTCLDPRSASLGGGGGGGMPKGPGEECECSAGIDSSGDSLRRAKGKGRWKKEKKTGSWGSNNKQNKTEEELPFSLPPSRGGGLGLIELVLLGSERRRRKSCSQGCQPLSSWLAVGGRNSKAQKDKESEKFAISSPPSLPSLLRQHSDISPKVGAGKKGGGGGAKLLSLFLSPSR